jgi:hypothetical protein
VVRDRTPTYLFRIQDFSSVTIEFSVQAVERIEGPHHLVVSLEFRSPKGISKKINFFERSTPWHTF